MTDLSFEANLPNLRNSSDKACFARYGLLGTTALCAAAFAAAPAAAGPKGGKVTGGKATISQSGATTTVKQSSKKAALTWKSLDVGEAESLVFKQPGTDAIALNRVLSDLPTNVLGNLTANGNVWIVNPNGIAFGPKSVVNVGGLLATTTDIPDADFFSDDFAFSSLTGSEAEYSKITAEGTIYAGKGGVVLVAPVIESSGLISTVGGDVTLATAQAFRVDFDGDGLLSFTVEAGAEGVLQLTESSSISAAGGAVYLSAGAADTVTESVVNVGGLVESTHVEQRGGEIILSGGLGSEVIVTAELSAIGAEGQKGGSIDVFGETVKLASGASLDVSGPAGGGSIRVGGDYQGKGDAPTAETTWVTADAMLNADATVDGDGGRIIVWADDSTVYQGSISAIGAGTGDGGFAEVSGKQRLAFDGYVDLSAENGDFGTLLLDPRDINIVSSSPVNDNGEIADGVILATDGDDDDFVITVAALEAVAADVSLAADQDITVEASFSISESGGPNDANLTFDAGRDLVLNASVSITTDGEVDFDAGRDIILNDDASITNTDNSDPNVNLNAGEQILFGDNTSITSNGSITLVAGGVGTGQPSDPEAAIVFGVSSTLTSNESSISVTSSSADATDSNSILMGGDFSADASTTLVFTSSDQIVFGAVLDNSDEQVFSGSSGTGSITIDSGSGATFSAGLEIVLLSDPDSTTVATEVDVTNSVLFTVTGAGDANDIIFQDDAAFTVSGGTAEFATTTAGDIEIQQDASIEATATGSLILNSANEVQIAASVTISADEDITVEGGQTFIASDDFTLDAGNDLTFTASGTTSIAATGTVTLMAGRDVIVDDNVTITAASSVKFDAGRNFSFAESGAHLIASAANLTIEANDNIFFGDNEDLSSSGTITISAQDNIDIQPLVDFLATGSISIEAGFIDDDDGGTIDIGNNFTADSASGSVSIFSSLDDDGGTDSNDITFEGNASLSAETTILIDTGDRVFLGSDDNSDTITFDASGGSTIKAAGNVTLDADGTDTTSLNVTGGLTIDTGNVNFDTGSTINVGTDTVTFTPFDDGLITVGGTGGLEVSEDDVAKVIAGEIAFDTDGNIVVDTFNFDEAATLSLTAGGTVSFDGDSTITAQLIVQATSTVTIESDDTLTVDGSGNDLSIISSDLEFGNGSSAIVVTDTLTLTAVADGNMSIGGGETWNISSAELDTQIDAAAIVIETTGAGSITVDGVTLDLDGGDGETIVPTLDLVSDDDVTFSGGASTFESALTVVADDDVTVSADVDATSVTITAGVDAAETGTIAINETLDSGGAMTLNADAITQSGNGAVVTTGVLNITATDSVDLGLAANSFGDRVSVDATGSISLVTSGALKIGDIDGASALFDASSYDLTSTPDVDVGTGTATFFFGSSNITVNEDDNTDGLALGTIDEAAFSFVNAGASVGVGTSGNITVDGASWTTKGISLIATGASSVIDFSGSASSFSGTVVIETQVAGASITQTAGDIITDSGAVFITQNALNLTRGGNAFSGPLSITAPTANVSNSVSTTLGDIETTGAFALTSGGDVTSASDASFDIGGTTMVTVSTTAATSVSVTLDAGDGETGSFTGDVTVVDADMATLDNVTIDATAQLKVSALDLAGDLSLSTTTGGVSQTGVWDIGGTSQLTAPGDIVASSSTNVFTGAVSASGTNVTLNASGDLTLDDIDATTLNVTVSGSVFDTNAATAGEGVNATTANVSATTTITLTGAENDFGTINASAGTVSIRDANDLNLGNITSSVGALTVTVDGNVSDTGTINASATASFIDSSPDPTATTTIELDNAANIFAGAINVTGEHFTLVDDAAVNLGLINLTGDLSVTTTAGGVSQSNSATVAGLTTIAASGLAVNLNNTSNDFFEIGVTASDTNIFDTNDLVFRTTTITGDLTVNTQGAVSQYMPNDPAQRMIVTENVVFVANSDAPAKTGTRQNITLNNPDNDFPDLGNGVTNTVSVHGDIVTIYDTDSIEFAPGGLDFNSLDISVDDLNTLLGSLISGGGLGGADLDLVSNIDNQDFVIGPGSSLLSKTVSDSVTLSMPVFFSTQDLIDVNAGTIGFTTIGANGDIYWEADGAIPTLTSDVSLTAGGDVIFADGFDQTFPLGATNTVTAIALGGDVTVNAGGDILQDAGTAISILDGISTFNATGSVTLNQTGNNFDYVVDGLNASAGTSINIFDASNLAIGDISSGGSVILSATGSLALTGDIEAVGAVSLNATSTIFNTANEVGDQIESSSTISIISSGSSVSITTIPILASTSVTVDASTSVSLDDVTTGLLNADAGTTLVLGGTTTATGAVDLDATGTITVSGPITVDSDDSGDELFSATSTGGGVSVTNTIDANGSVDIDASTTIVLSGSDIDAEGAVDLDAGGNITVSGPITVDSDDSGAELFSATSTGGGVSVTNTIDANGSVDIDASTTIVLSGSDIDAEGAVDLDATGTITVSGPITVDSDDSGNELFSATSTGGGVSVTNTVDANGSVDFDASTTIVLSGSDIDAEGAVDLDAGGNITISGPITVDSDDSGAELFSATSTGGGISVTNTIDANGALDFDASTTVILSGATTDVDDNVSINATGTVTLDGAVTSSSGNVAATTGGNFVDSNAASTEITASGTVTVNATGTASVDDVSSTGTITVNATSSVTLGALTSSGGGISASSTGSIINALDDLNASGAISLTGFSIVDYFGSVISTDSSVSMTSSASVIRDRTIGSSNGVSASTTINLNGSNFVDVDDLVATGTITLSSSNSFVRLNGPVTTGGNLSATAGSTFIDSSAVGTAIAASGTVTVNATSTVTLHDIAATGTISATSGAGVNANGALTSGDQIILSANGGNFVDGAAASTDINATTSITVNASGTASLDDVSTTGTLQVSATNDISLEGVVSAGAMTLDTDANITDGASNGTAIVISGATTLTADATGTIDLDDTSNDFGSVDVTQAGSFAISDQNGFTTGGINIGATGSLSITINVGGGTEDVTQTAAITAGETTINAGGGDVLLDDPGNVFGNISVTAHDLVLVEADEIRLNGINLSGALEATSSTGRIINFNFDTSTRTPVTVAETSTFTVPNNQDVNIFDGAIPITLIDFGGAVTVTSSDQIFITDANDLILGSISSSSTFTSILRANGSISDSGADTIQFAGTLDADANWDGVGGGSITFDNAGHDFGGTVFLAGVDATISDTNSLEFGTTNLTGNLDVTTGGDAAHDITQTGILNVSGTSNFDIGAGDLFLNTFNNDFGDVVDISSSNAATTSYIWLRDVDNIVLGDIEQVGTAGYLYVQSGGAITQTAGPDSISVLGDTYLYAWLGGLFDVDVDNPLNDFVGDVHIIGANGFIADANALTLDYVDLSGGLTASSTNATQIDGFFDVEDDFTLDASGVTASTVLNVGNAAGDNLVVNANGGFQTTAALEVTGTTDFNTSGGDVVANNSGNTFGGDVTVDAVNATIAADASGIRFGSSDITNQLNLTTRGDVTQAARIAGGADVDVRVNAAGVDIQLGNSNNDFDSFAINPASTHAANSLTLRDRDELDLGNIDVTNNFVLEVDGDVDASTNVFKVGGSTTIDSNGGFVTITNGGNTFGGAVDVDGGDVSLSGSKIGGAADIDGNDVTLDISSIGGALNVDASGTVDIQGTTYEDDVDVLSGSSVSIDIAKIGGEVDVDATSDVDIDSASVAGAVRVKGDDVAIDVNNFGDFVRVTADNATIDSQRAVQLQRIRVSEDLVINANKNGALGAGSSEAAIRQTIGGSINVSGTTTLDANGADIDLLSANIITQLAEFVNPTQPNTFGGAVTVTDANEIHLGSSTDLTIGGMKSTGPGGEIVLLAPDFELAGPISAPTIKIFSSGGSTVLGTTGGAGANTTNTELANLSASSGLLLYEAGDMTISDLSLSGGKLGGLTLFVDGNVVISGDFTSSGLNANESNALNLSIIGPDNIYITGKLGVEGEDTLKPLGDLTLLAKNDILIGTERFISITDTAQFEGANLEVDLSRLNETIIHTVGAGPNLSTVTFGASGNIAMQTTSSNVGTGMDIGTLVLTKGVNGGAPEFINLFGDIVVDGKSVSDTAAALGVTLDGIPINLEYELNGCVIRSFDCTAFGAILTTIPFDDSLFLDLSIEPEEEEDDDPFTNRGNEEEWR